MRCDNVSITSQPSRKLNENAVTKAIAELKIAKLTAEMDRVGWSTETVEALSGYIRRASGLIIRYPNPPKMAKRDAFADELIRLAGANLNGAAQELGAAFYQIGVAEDGFHRIIGFMNETDWHKLTPQVRVAALIERAGREVELAIKNATTQLGQKPSFNLIAPVIRDEGGRPMDVEAPISAIVSGLSASIMMVGHQEGWFSGDQLVLPDLPLPTKDDVEVSGWPLSLAAGWHRWETIEEQARFIGPNIVEVTDGDVPDFVDPGHDLVYKYDPPDRLWYNEVATWRFGDRVRQTRAESAREFPAPTPTAIEDRPPLAPKAIICENEYLSFLGLCERLGMDISENKRLIAGLKLPEWLRGFSALSVLAGRKFEDNPTWHQVWNHRDILSTLTKAGLTSDKASRFISNVTVNKKTRDFFDAPLLKMSDQRYMVFIPTMRDSSPYEIMMSVFSGLKESFDGKPFERRVLELFRENGIPAENVKFKVGGQEYDCDAVAVWNEQVFLLECKNKSLPGSRATLAYHFDSELLGDIVQVGRLRDGLVANPEQLNQRFGPGTSDLPITMIVLRNALYARNGDHHGVYFYDFSALSRFFKSRHMQVSTGPQNGPFVTSETYATLWSSETPSASDLLEELKDPVQLRLNRFHTRKLSLVQGLDSKTCSVSSLLVRDEISAASLLAFKDYDLKMNSQRGALPSRE
jgi:hypothetical protein